MKNFGIVLFLLISTANGFAFHAPKSAQHAVKTSNLGLHQSPCSSRLSRSFTSQPLHSVQDNGVPDMSAELDAAKVILEAAKAKLAMQGATSEGKQGKGQESDESHVKEKTPLGVIADSEAMVRSSEAGEWTGRKIDDMFVDISESELDEDELLEEREKREKWSKLRERDVATSVMGLQKQLHAEDFEKIFSRKNPRIGER
ncbi:hypothetical protein TrST_g6312 [Triparma strigata]|uniref:Uncharacterized protein n=1 Tax=Triparma strigata TaxID=1606541 RepID=A0A9W7F125_9STRA|nr:hypothetical protein TrST_g6312 [Triparma strigata]